jgi:hypothetical protein
MTPPQTRPTPAPRPVLELWLGDIVRLRKRHPCGGHDWLVDRLGADIGLRCQTCGRHVLLERRVLEARLVSFLVRGDPQISAAVVPPVATGSS